MFVVIPKMNDLQQVFVKYGRSICVSTGSILFSRGRPASAIFQVKSGKVLLHATSPNGREIGLEITTDGCLFGFSALIPKAGALVDAVALTDCELLIVHRERAQQLLLEHPSLAVNALESSLSLLSNCINRIEELSSYNLRSRLARWLLDQFRAKGVNPTAGATIEIELSQRLMATMAGVSRETVNRQLKKWEHAGILEWAPGGLRVFRPEALERLSFKYDRKRK